MYERNARPNNNQLITYYLPVCYLLRIQQKPVNTTYNKKYKHGVVIKSHCESSKFLGVREGSKMQACAHFKLIQMKNQKHF